MFTGYLGSKILPGKGIIANFADSKNAEK